MGLIKITSDSPEDLFKAPEFPVLPAGRHLFTVAKVEMTETKERKIPMLKVELRCQDEDDNKGMPIFDQFMIISQPTDEKMATSKRINDAAFAQFVVACGVLTQEQMKAGESFDFEDLKDRDLQAVTKVTLEDTYPKEFDENGNVKKRQRAGVSKYLFEPQQS